MFMISIIGGLSASETQDQHRPLWSLGLWVYLTLLFLVGLSWQCQSNCKVLPFTQSSRRHRLWLLTLWKPRGQPSSFV